MANTSVSGLVSGLDTATIISQLMQLEAQPQTAIKNRVSAAQAEVTALQNINTKLAGIFTKTADLAKVANWAPAAAASSNDKVTVTADAGSAASQLTFSVEAVATNSRASYTTVATQSAKPMAADASYTITFGDGSTFDFKTGDGSLGAIAAALNASGSKVDAALVHVGTDGTTGEPTYVLNVQSESTGSKSTFTIAPTGTSANTTSFLGGPVTAPAGTDASIRIQGQSQSLTSSSNTFVDLMPGVDVTLGAVAIGDKATLTVAHDPKAMSDSVKAMVDAVNSVLSDVDTQTAYNPTTKKSGILAGDSLLRGLRDQLLSAVTSGVGGKSFADVGIQADRNGKLVFDEAKFQAAYTADPSGTAATFTDSVTTTSPPTPAGLASTFAAITKVASNSVDGTLTQAIQGRNSAIRGMNDDIADWDVRLQTKQASLQRQYAALEVALGKMQDQASWLSGQISSLPKMG